MVTRDDIRRLSPPPRKVGLSVVFELLFGGVRGHFGWMWLNSSLIFVFVFGVNDALKNLVTMGTESVVSGRVVSVEPTNTTVNEETVYAVTFMFTLEGVTHEGVSHSTDPPYDAGEPAEIILVGGDVDSATIEGLRNTMVPVWTVFLILVFPAIGIAMTYATARAGLRTLRILRHGIAAYGTYEGAEPTGLTVNDEPMMRHSFAFRASGRKHTAAGETLTPGAILDEAQEPILYLSDSPEESMPFDVLGNVLEVGPAGGLISSRASVGLSLLWPLCFICMIWLFW